MTETRRQHAERIVDWIGLSEVVEPEPVGQREHAIAYIEGVLQEYAEAQVRERVEEPE
jgi:hypothetical protein